MIHIAQIGSGLDNVHITNANIKKTGADGVGSLVRYMNGGSIKNCSANNINIEIEGTPNELYIGGLVGFMGNSTITNCYVQGLNINDTKAINSAVGGIVGYANATTSLLNCYAEGKINSDNINVGGIIGNLSVGNIENCYSKVNISSTNSDIGGIAGIFSGSDINTISNNLSLGSIYTTSGIESLGRIVGDNLDTTNNNYAYQNQSINGYTNSNTLGAKLLTKEEVLTLNLGESYNYDEKEKQVLPKLYNTEKTEFLPNQVDIFIDNTNNIMLEVENIEAEKTNTTEAEINIRINNPEEVEITRITIEDMTSTITRNITQNGTTNITLRATPERYYDRYKLTEIGYKAKNSEEEQTKEVETEIQVQFYKELYTYEEWQSIEEGTYQNYRLMADIDFSGRTNVNNNITVNRLEAENNMYTLKNITLEYNTGNVGLINNVKTSMKNIGFENITLTNTASSGEYFGLISSNNGNLENLKFQNITINGKSLNYIGIIGTESSGTINNIELNNITILGNEYVGGFIGNFNIPNSELKNINADNMNVTGISNYVGGIIGYQDGNDIETNNIFISNSYVEGYNYTGGIAGYIDGVNLSYCEVNSTDIVGNTYVGGITGWLWAGNASCNRVYLEINNCDILGKESYIGGITGLIYSGQCENWSVYDSKINATSINSIYVGGLAGISRHGNLYWSELNNTEINSNGTNVGGALGSNYSGSSITLYGININKCKVQGYSGVGGACGSTDGLSGTNLYINAQIKATAHTAGGVLGYLENENMTATSNKVTIIRTIIVDSTIDAPTKAGGFIGDIESEIYRAQSFYYNNYIDADVTSENESTGSLIIGGRPDENEYITNTYVYRYNKLNGNYVYTTNDNIKNNQYLVRNDLEQQSTYTNTIKLSTSEWDYTLLQENKYPKVKNTYFIVEEGVDLPTDPEIIDLNSLNNEEDNNAETNAENSISVQNIEDLPEVIVYPISINEINIDFSNVSDGLSFTYYINGTEIENLDLTEKTYTFGYNFVDEIEIVISNGIDEENITIEPSDVRSEISLVGDNYAYLIGNNLYINGELQSGEYVNVYEGYALSSRGEVIDISTLQVINDEIVETSLEKSAKPLYTYEYNGNNIDVYGTYSKIDGNVKSQIYNVRSGKLSALSNSLGMKINNYIVDQYNDKEYQTILTNSGEIVDLKEQLQYPDNFLSRNVKQIVQNSNVENPEMMVIYNTGKVIVFNYVNGNVIYETEEKADSGLANYITGSINSIWSDYESKQSEYLRSKQLIAKLAEMPIEEVLNEVEENANNADTNKSVESINNINIGNINSSITNNTANKNEESYITVYNGETGEYEVYSETEILEGTEEDPVSETEKIKENGLESIYNYEQEEEIGNKVNGAIIVAIIIGIAIISLIILRKLIYRSNTKK